MNKLLLLLLVSCSMSAMFVNQKNEAPNPEGSSVAEQNNASVNVHVEILTPRPHHHHAKRLSQEKQSGCCCNCMSAACAAVKKIISCIH